MSLVQPVIFVLEREIHERVYHPQNLDDEVVSHVHTLSLLLVPSYGQFSITTV